MAHSVGTASGRWSVGARLRVRLRSLDRVEVAAFAGIFVAAFALRLVGLTGRPLHHDESDHGWISWQLFTGQGYHYDPVYHGPVQFYVDALNYLWLGVGETALRFGSVLAGSAMTLLPALLRRQLGRGGALTAALLLCVSPSYLYYSRFAREDIYAAVLTLALIVVAFRWLDRPRRWHPALLLGLLAASFATKESTFITCFVGGGFFLAAIAREAWLRRRQPAVPTPVLQALRSVGADAWGWGAASFVSVFTLLFTQALVNPQGLRDGLYEGLHYWLTQQPVGRGAQPAYFYAVLLVAYELPVLVLAAVGVVTSLRRPTLFRAFLVWDAAFSFAVYSWAGERMPWLTLHPLLPLILLAGVGAQTLLGGRRGRVGLAAIGLAGAAFTAFTAWNVVYDHPADPSEPLVFVQTATDVPGARDDLVAVIRAVQRSGRDPRILVDSWGGTGWPWGWYLRDEPVGYPDLSVDPERWVRGADAVLVPEPDEAAVAPLLAGYRRETFTFRRWWVVDYGALTPSRAWRWFLHRERWGVEGTIEGVAVRARLALLRPQAGGTLSRRPR